MIKYLTVGAGLLLLSGSGVALAQMPPGGGPDGPGPRGPMHPEPWEMGRMPHHPLGGGTAFRFRKGDAEVDIACSLRDPLQECVAAASALMDKISSTASKPATTP